MDYSKAFRVIRATYGVSQGRMAECLRISSSALSLIEHGERKPSLKTIEALSNATGFTVPAITAIASETYSSDTAAVAPHIMQNVTTPKPLRSIFDDDPGI
jgi:transcriptional regulator with XRE-family HTH domain